MAGLLNKQEEQQPQPGMPSAGGNGRPAPQEGEQLTAGPGAEGGENVSPEEQEAYNEFVSNGLQLIYSEKAMPQILESIEAGGNPIQGLANSMVMVVVRLEDSAQDQGREFSGDVKLHAATEIMEHMVELAEAAGVHEYSEEDMESALYLGMDIYRSIRQEEGSLPVEELSQDMQALMEADKQGRLDEIIPGIEEFAKNAPKPEDMQQQQPAPEAAGGEQQRMKPRR